MELFKIENTEKQKEHYLLGNVVQTKIRNSRKENWTDVRNKPPFLILFLLFQDDCHQFENKILNSQYWMSWRLIVPPNERHIPPLIPNPIKWCLMAFTSDIFFKYFSVLIRVYCSYFTEWEKCLRKHTKNTKLMGNFLEKDQEENN